MTGPGEKATAWIYSGIWAILVSWFRVPKEPPHLPGVRGESTSAVKPDLGLMRYQKFWFWLLFWPMDLGLLIIWIVIYKVSHLWAAITFVPFLALAVLPDVVTYVAIHLRYDTTWYVFSPRALRIRRGIWAMHETTITYENIQNVDVRQGPVQRHFGVSTLQVRTAGGGAGGDPSHGGGSTAHIGIMEGIADPQGLRDMIMARAAASRSAGIGDERRSEITPAHPAGPAWTPAHLAMLREIRDTAKAIRV